MHPCSLAELNVAYSARYLVSVIDRGSEFVASHPVSESENHLEVEMGDLVENDYKWGNANGD